MRTWESGESTPAPPAGEEAAALVEAVDPPSVEISVTCLRVLLTGATASAARPVLRQLGSEPAVQGTSVAAECGPARSDSFDALLAPEHDPLVASQAVAQLDPVEGVALAKFDADALLDPPAAESDGGTTTRDAGASGQHDTAAAEEPGASEDGQARFSELQSEISQVEYDELVTELDEAGFEVTEGESVDLDPMLADLETESVASSDADSPDTVGSADTFGESDVSTGSRGIGNGDTTPGSDTIGNGGSESGDASETLSFGHRPTGAGGDDGSSDGEADDSPLDPDEVLSALVTALDQRTLRESELDTLRDALGVGNPESERVRLQHLSQRVNELMAYRNELETFIDDTEGGERVYDLEQRVEVLSSEMASLEETTELLSDRVESDDSREQLARIENRLDGIEDGLQGVAADVESLQSELASLREWRENLESALVGEDDD